MNLNEHEELLLVPPWLRRCTTGSVGMVLGALTALPDAMMASCDPTGTERGLVASSLFVLGGILGCGCNRWEFLLPRFVMQAIAFAGFPPTMLVLGILFFKF